MKVTDVNSKHIPMRRESGFTIVEMMVGVLIGLIAIVVMMQMFAVSEGQKRTTAGAGEAQQNGVSSLYLLQRDARMAGYGISLHPLLGCQTIGFYNPTAAKFNFRLVPVLIGNGLAGTAPDTMTILYGNTDQFEMPGSMTLATSPLAGGTTGFVTVAAPYSVKNGSIVVLGEAPNIVAPANPALGNGKNCTMMQITTQIAPTGADNTRMHYDGNFYVDEGGATRAADFNPPSGIMSAPDNVGYTKWDETRHIGGRVMNLGLQPVGTVYSIVNNQLVARNIFAPADPPIIISDGIVQFQAQYGYSSNCPSFYPGSAAISPAPTFPPAGYVPPCSVGSSAGSVAALTPVWPPAPNRDQWADSVDAATMTPNQWRQIIAIRFVVVARSAQKERVNPATGQCEATTVLPKWVSGDSRDLHVEVSDPLDWKCYRYKTFEGTVPLRNIIWTPDPAGSSQPPG
jgi:type IV pilus assembly protein PilW